MLVTYHIVSDRNSQLHNATKLSCSFWNKFVVPETSIVIRLSVFTQFGNTIARAYEPYYRDGVKYGAVEFNTQFLDRFSQYEIVGTLIHEIGHTLGIGWDRWMNLFDAHTGKFNLDSTEIVPDLEKMLVETDYGPGTTLVHWDEMSFDKELMTGLKGDDEYVLPVTIDVMELLGHKIQERLTESRKLSDMIDDLRGVVFSQSDEATQINREAYVKTDIWEEIYSYQKSQFSQGLN